MSNKNNNYYNQNNDYQKHPNYNGNGNNQYDYNQQCSNYNNSNSNQQYHNYGNGQQGFNQQYQNYNNLNQQYQNYNEQKHPNFMNSPQNLNNNFNPNKKKRSKFIPIISTILGLVLIGSSGLFYYSKTTNKSISSIFSTSKNDEEIYAPILEKYKQSMDNNELGENSEVNKFAIKSYDEHGKEKNYITYSYYDVDEDGKNELVIAEKDKPNSPFAVYSYNSNKIIVLYQAESRNDIPRATFYKDRTIWIHTKEKNYDRYVVYKLNDKKDKPVIVLRKYSAWEELFKKILEEVKQTEQSFDKELVLSLLEKGFFYCQLAPQGGGITDGNVISVPNYKTLLSMKEYAFKEISSLLPRIEFDKKSKLNV